MRQRKRERSITEISLDKKVHVGYNRIRKEDYDKLSVILLYLGKESEEEILGLLQTLLDETIQSERKLAILEEEYGIVMDDETRKEIREMCNLGDYVENKGMAKGIEETTAEFAAFIQNMMNQHHFTAEEVFDMMQIPEKTRNRYRQYLKDPS